MDGGNGIVRVAQGGVLRLGFDRPARKNAMTGAMYAALAEALVDADRDEAVRAVILHGSEDAFCAGNDIGDFASNAPDQGERPSARFMKALLRLRKPVVAAVNGPAVGIGATMLLHCDLVYAGTGAKLVFPFARLGLCPEFASTLLLPAKLGHQRAAELLMLGDPCSAQEAHTLGLVNAVMPPADVLPHASDVAARLAAMSVASLHAAKSLMRGDELDRYEERMEKENAQFSRLLVSPEAKSAFAAFQQRGKS
ncbi:enoyl-CoA hydratase [Variovorax sp. E3]|uniref:enoyl-CoA hydratase n=1 Tax=Variovorax sp. E3 TaxID=1914993 RepID=UPI0018DE2B33|nr:enoyl-CoA hydratase [Variovorax sp. E3]